MIKKTMLFLLALGAIHCRGSEDFAVQGEGDGILVGKDLDSPFFRGTVSKPSAGNIDHRRSGPPGLIQTATADKLTGQVNTLAANIDTRVANLTDEVGLLSSELQNNIYQQKN